MRAVEAAFDALGDARRREDVDWAREQAGGKREQEQLESLHTEGAAMCSSDESDLDDLDSTLLDAVKQKKLLLRQQARGHRGKLPRGAGPEHGLREAVSHLSSLGIETSAFEKSSRKHIVWILPATARGRVSIVSEYHLHMFV